MQAPGWRAPKAADMVALLLPIGHGLRGLEVSTSQDTGLEVSTSQDLAWSIVGKKSGAHVEPLTSHGREGQGQPHVHLATSLLALGWIKLCRPDRSCSWAHGGATAFIQCGHEIRIFSGELLVPRPHLSDSPGFTPVHIPCQMEGREFCSCVVLVTMWSQETFT